MAETHDAFISYSHEADSVLAAAIEAGLEKLAKPLLKLRAVNVFRDETSLAANPKLWSSIVSHLSDSKWFLLMASSQSAASEWCNRELLWWIENRNVDRILIILTHDELVWDSDTGDFNWLRTTALSPVLKGKLIEEPHYIDLRWAFNQKNLSLTEPRFRSAILDLASPIRNVPKDQLDGEDVQQLKRNKSIVRGLQTGIACAASIAMVFAVVAWLQRNEARRQRDEAILQSQVALSQKLSSEALRTSEDNVDRALLLALTALDIYPTSDAQISLFATLLKGRYSKFERTHNQPSMMNGEEARACSTNLAELITPENMKHAAGWPNPADMDFSRGTCFSSDWYGARVAALIETNSIATAARFPAELAIWDVKNHEKVMRSTIHFGRVTALQFSPDGNFLVSGDAHGTALLWRRAGLTGWQYEPLYGHKKAIIRAEFERESRVLITESSDGDIIHWDIRRPQSLAVVLDDQKVATVDGFGFMRVAFAKGGQFIIATGPGGKLLAWKTIDRGNSARVIATINGITRSLSVSHNGDLVSVASNSEVRVINLESGREYSTQQSCQQVAGLSFSPDDEILAFGGSNCLRLWRFETVAEPKHVELPESFTNRRVYDTKFSPDGKALLLAGTFGVISWPISGMSLGESPNLLYREGLITKIAVSRDAHLLSVGNWDGDVAVISLYDPQSKPVQLAGHRGGAIMGLSFSPNAEVLASADANGTAILWDLNRAEPLVRELKSGGISVTGLDFSPDGSAFAVGSDNRVVTVWPFGVDAWRLIACSIANRDLTREEWQQFLPAQPYRSTCFNREPGRENQRP